MKFNYKFFLATIIIFLVEVAIATVFKDIVWLRSYFGDVLVVILIYTFVLSFFRFGYTQRNKLVLWTFLFACAIEFAQYFHFGELLGLGKNKIAMIVLGNSFSWVDILCYAFGCLAIYIFNKFYLPKVS